MTSKFILLLLLSVVILACSKKEQFPSLISHKISDEVLTVNAPIIMKSVNGDDTLNSIISDELPKQLIQKKNLYDRKDADFNLAETKKLWEDIKNRDGKFSFSVMKNWISATGFLFEITGDERYIAALEKIQYRPNYVAENEKSEELTSLLEPYIFTRNNDFFHVNLFANASVNFEHSLFGKIEITQETDFPISGDVNLKFKSEEDRYMEIFVRIPQWAEGATVTVGNVKYIAPPGGYCKIAKKWSEDDLAEIRFPIEKIPAYYQN